MDLDTLKNLIQTTSWFSALGQAYPQKEGVISVNGDQWRPFIAALTGAEFGLPHNIMALEAFPFADFDWLPTNIYESDPFREEMLIVKGRWEEVESTYKAARLEIFKLAQVALRSATEHPLLKVGPANMAGSAREAALFACRTAAAELVLGRPDFWCDLVLLYHAGHWPFGTMKSGEVVVL